MQIVHKSCQPTINHEITSINYASNIGILYFHTKCFREVAGDEYIIENIDHSIYPPRPIPPKNKIKTLSCAECDKLYNLKKEKTISIIIHLMLGAFTISIISWNIYIVYHFFFRG